MRVQAAAFVEQLYTRARRAMLHRLRAATINPDVLPKTPR
jgi:hypothetical protein